MNGEQMAAAVARVKELDAKRELVAETMRLLSMDAPFSLAHRKADDERHALNVALQQEAPQMAALIAQLWDEREKNRAVMVQARDALARAREYAVGDAFIQIEQSLAALKDALGGE